MRWFIVECTKLVKEVVDEMDIVMDKFVKNK